MSDAPASTRKKNGLALTESDRERALTRAQAHAEYLATLEPEDQRAYVETIFATHAYVAGVAPAPPAARDLDGEPYVIVGLKGADVLIGQNLAVLMDFLPCTSVQDAVEMARAFGGLASDGGLHIFQRLMH